MVSTAPIGIFDSGLGGLSVAASIHQLLPQEDLLFFGDSANAPYGTQEPSQVRQRCFSIADELVAQGVKAIVVACNTATSVCIEDLRQRYSIPIVGMEPALKLACERGKGKPQTVIVAATNLTLKEHKFATLLEQFTPEHTIWSQPCPDMVTMVESGQLDKAEQVEALIDSYFGSYPLSTVDSIVLGCTHFVFYRSYLTEYCPSGLALVDGNAGTARHLKDLLARSQQLQAADRLGQVSIHNSKQAQDILNLSWQLFRSASHECQQEEKRTV